MGIAEWVEIVALMLLPTMLVAGALHAGPAVRAVRRFVTTRSADTQLHPTHPPIERLAADLRRLLERYETVKRTADLPMRAQRLRAVEGAISDCALQTASALDLVCPDRPPRRGLSTTELRRLLLALVDAGLVLPPAVAL